MIDKEKLRELCNRFVDVAIDDEDKVITEWLEQNPLVSTETKVVGLTEKQIKRLVAYIDVSSESLYDDIVTFLETQTFAQPEAKEAPVGLSDEQICELADYISDADYEHHFKSKSDVITEYLKTQAFAQQYKTDGFAEIQLEECGIEYRALKEELEQLKSQQDITDGGWRDKYDSLHIDYEFLLDDLKECKVREKNVRVLLDERYNFQEKFDKLSIELEQLKLQQDITDGGWRGKYDRLHVDYNLLLAELKECRIREIPMLDEQCKFKDQFDNLNMELKAQSTPSWDCAPSWANWYAEDFDLQKGWYEREPKPTISYWLTTGGKKQVINNACWKETLQERPKPTPQVEVRQVWSYGVIEATVKCVNNDEVVLCNNYSGKFSVNAMSDFLAKFERVGGSNE